MRTLVATAVAAVSLLGVASASGHGLGSHTGFQSTVSTIEPFQPGLLVRVLGGHERISVANFTQKDVVIFDGSGRVLRRIPAGQTRVWADPRIGATEEPPDEEGLIRYWRIRGTADAERFEILGFLGYRPPADEEEGEDAVPTWAYVAAGVVGVVVLGAAIVLPRRRART